MAELLAPAGNPAALHAAVRAGANAVYLGVGEFNARRNAENFTFSTLAEGCDYAHLRSRKVYVAMNTLVLPGELGHAMDCAWRCHEAGADAFIVQDVGLAAQMRKELPDARVHVSTQMNIHNEAGVCACADLGARRITLSRELSVGEIEHLCDVAKSLGIEIEVFAHGALCVCYSGQCLMSSMIGGRSANRGLCAQACRLPYRLMCMGDSAHEVEVRGNHLLSPKDLCTIGILADLVRIGVSSLKIEGRMKSPEYVYSVTKVYREELDEVESRLKGAEAPAQRLSCEVSATVDAEPGKSDAACRDRISRLESVFSRGFTSAYLEGVRDNSMMGYQRPNNRGQFIGRVKSIEGSSLKIATESDLVSGDVLEIWSKRGNGRVIAGDVFRSKDGICVVGVSETSKGGLSNANAGDRVFRVRSASAAYADSSLEPRIEVVGKAMVKIGEPLYVEFCSAANPEISASAQGSVVEAARTKPLSKQDIAEHIGRMGSTPFRLAELDVDLSDGAGLGFSQLHKARSCALDKLESRMLGRNTSHNLLSDAADARKAHPAGPFTGGGHEQAYMGRTHPLPSEPPHPERKPARVEARARSGQRGPTSDALSVEVAAIAANPDCARAAKRAGADSVYVSALNYRRGQSQMRGAHEGDVRRSGFPKKCTIMIPSIDHDLRGLSREAQIGGDAWEYAESGKRVYVDSFSALCRAASIGALPEIGPGLPIVNRSSVDVASSLGAVRIWLSPELNLFQLRDLVRSARQGKELGFGIKVFGAQELMVCEHCILMAEGDCSQDCRNCPRRGTPHALNDRKGYDFPIAVDMYGRSHIYNGVKLDCVHAIPDLVEAGISALMVDTTLMDPEEAAQATGRVVAAVKSLACGQGALAKLPNTTSGHLYRGVK